MESRNRVQEIMCFFLSFAALLPGVFVCACWRHTFSHILVPASTHIVCADGATWPNSLVHEPTKSAARHPGHLTKAQLLPDDVGTGSSARG